MLYLMILSRQRLHRLLLTHSCIIVMDQVHWVQVDMPRVPTKVQVQVVVDQAVGEVV